MRYFSTLRPLIGLARYMIPMLSLLASLVFLVAFKLGVI